MSLGPVAEAVVNEWVQAGELLTAHDVTLEVRTRGHRASHDEIKSAVHDYYNRGGLGVDYSRSIISTPTGNPWLYHRQVDDPQTYKNIRGNIGNSVPIPVMAVDPNAQNQPVAIPGNLLNNLNGRTNIQNKAGETKNRVVDARETLSIPVGVVRSVGFTAGQTVFVSTATFNKETVLDICDGINPGGGRARSLGSYTVDCHDQIRITQGLLKKAGIGGNKYDIEELNDGNKSYAIRVKLAK